MELELEAWKPLPRYDHVHFDCEKGWTTEECGIWKKQVCRSSSHGFMRLREMKSWTSTPRDRTMWPPPLRRLPNSKIQKGRCSARRATPAEPGRRRQARVVVASMLVAASIFCPPPCCLDDVHYHSSCWTPVLINFPPRSTCARPCKRTRSAWASLCGVGSMELDVPEI